MIKIINILIIIIFLISCKRDYYSCDMYLINKMNKKIIINLIKENDTLSIDLLENEKYLILGNNYIKYQPNEIFYLKFDQFIISFDTITINISHETNFAINPFINRGLWHYQGINSHPLGLRGKAFELAYKLSIDSTLLQASAYKLER